MTLVSSKIYLESFALGHCLGLVLKGGEDSRDAPRSLTQKGPSGRIHAIRRRPSLDHSDQSQRTAEAPIGDFI